MLIDAQWEIPYRHVYACLPPEYMGKIREDTARWLWASYNDEYDYMQAIGDQKAPLKSIIFCRLREWLSNWYDDNPKECKCLTPR